MLKLLLYIVWWCLLYTLCCYLLIIYCNKLYKSFCFWWWNQNEKQKYNTDINICTNKSGPFIHETEHARYMQSSSFGSKKLAPCKNFSWLLTFKTGTWKWHLAIFLAPTFWEPEQPLDYPFKLYAPWKRKLSQKLKYCWHSYYKENNF
jgi:hypothetical protein